MAYAILLISPGRWLQAKTQQPIGVVSLVIIIHVNAMGGLFIEIAWSVILTRLDYCNSVLYGAPSSSIQILQQVQNNAARIVLQAPRRSRARPSVIQVNCNCN